MSSIRLCPRPVLLLSLSVGALLLAAAPTPASACSGLACSAGEVFPRDGANIPANAFLLLLRAPRQKLQQPVQDLNARLLRVDGETPVELAIEQKALPAGLLTFIPSAALTAGSKLRFEYAEPACDPVALGTTVTNLTVTEPAPLPTSLGKLGVTTKRGPVSMAGGSLCWEDEDAAYVDLSVSLADLAKPFQDVIEYAPLVDGELRARYIAIEPGYRGPVYGVLGGSGLGRGMDRVVALCGVDASPTSATVLPGKHRLALRGTLPDGTQVDTDEVEVDLRCDGKPAGGTGATSDGGVQSDGAIPDETSAAASPFSDSEGCSLLRSSARSDATWLVALAGLLGLRRKRQAQ